MQKASVMLQCIVRMKLACLRVLREKRRKAIGPEVVEVLRRGVRVSGLIVSVVISRCGGSYKVVGNDMVRGDRYEGYFYEPQVNTLLEEFNSQFKVRGWVGVLFVYLFVCLFVCLFVSIFYIYDMC